MARPPLPCRFYNSPGGCRRGGDCRFLHISRNTDREETPRSPRLSSSSSPTPRSSAPLNPEPPTSLSLPVPKGICRFYWENGSCKREFGCHFEHTRKTQSIVNGSPAARLTVTSQAAHELIAPFLTEKGLAKINGSGTDGFFAQDTSTSLSPTEAHNHLKRFLSDHFRFKYTFLIYAFLIPLSSANAANRLWVNLTFYLC